MVNRYGLKMVGLRGTSALTKGIEGYPGYRIDLYYNKRSGDVWGKMHSIGMNTLYHDDDICYVGTVKTSQTMQDIADRVAFNIKDN